ncbi:MAG: hypothetical protein AB2693_21360, partial [Candidatus Thiodiazotropha sp.]
YPRDIYVRGISVIFHYCNKTLADKKLIISYKDTTGHTLNFCQFIKIPYLHEHMVVSHLCLHPQPGRLLVTSYISVGSQIITRMVAQKCCHASVLGCLRVQQFF